MMGELSLALQGWFPAQLHRQYNPFPPLPALFPAPSWGAACWLHWPPGGQGMPLSCTRPGQGGREKWKRSMGQRRMKQSKPKERI